MRAKYRRCRAALHSSPHSLEYRSHATRNRARLFAWRACAPCRFDKGQSFMNAIAFQGENGAYSQQAIFDVFGPETRTVGFHSFQDIFHAVDSGAADSAILPIENSTAGAINQSYDLLLENDLKITHEVV